MLPTLRTAAAGQGDVHPHQPVVAAGLGVVVHQRESGIVGRRPEHAGGADLEVR